MNNVTSFLSKLSTPWTRDTESSGPSPQSPAQAVDPSVRYEDACDRIEVPPVHPSVVAGLDWVGARLDQTKAAFSGPYNVAGAVVSAPCQFRMNGGCNESQARGQATQRILQRVAGNVGLTSQLAALQEGRADSTALVKLTQALIDDDQLEPGSTQPLAQQIQALQWRFGIGVDCAGYVYNALKAIQGDPSKLGLRPTRNEDFTGLPQNAKFSSVAPEAARAGDVLVLKGGGTSRDPGHNLIVRSHVTTSDPSCGTASKWPAAAALIAKAAGKVDVFEVDSSFGAGPDGRAQGGSRRDVLLYDRTTKAWTTCKDVGERGVIPETSVPYAESALTGFFRAKVSP